MLGLSRPPPRSAAWVLNLPLSRNLGLRGWHICLRSFHLCFLLDSREKGEAVPGQEQGSQAPAFPSGLQPCCISSNPVLVGFTAPGAALGALGSLLVLGESSERPWSEVWVGAGWGGGSWSPPCTPWWICAMRGGRGLQEQAVHILLFLHHALSILPCSLARSWNYA